MEKITENVNQLCELMDSFVKTVTQADKKPSTFQKTCTEIALRMRINLQACNPHIQNVNSDTNEFLPIALLYRCIISDILTLCHIIRFYDVESDDQDQPSILNEILLLERDFVSSMIHAIEKEQFISRFIPVKGVKKPHEIQKDLKDLKDRFPNLFHNGKMLTTNQIRATSLNKFFPNKKNREIPEGTKMLSESYKYDTMMQEGIFSNFAMIISAFKFYSMYHHFSPSSHIAHEDVNRNKFYLYMTIDLVYMAYILYFQVSEKNHQQWLEKLLVLKEQLPYPQ